MSKIKGKLNKISEESPNKKNALISFIILLLTGGILIYWTLPSYMLYIDSIVAKATITKIEKHNLQFTYHNRYDNSDYVLSREINKKEYELLKNRKQIDILYPNLFPTSAIIKEIEKRPILLFVLPHLAILFALFKYGQDFMKSKSIK